MVYHHVRQQACHLMPCRWIAHFQLKLASTCIKVFTFGCLNWAKRCGGVALMKPSDSEADKVGLRDRRRIRTLWESFSFFFFSAGFTIVVHQRSDSFLRPLHLVPQGSLGKICSCEVSKRPFLTLPLKWNLELCPWTKRVWWPLRWMRKPAQLSASFWLPECLGQNSRLADLNWNRKSQIQIERLRSG